MPSALQTTRRQRGKNGCRQGDRAKPRIFTRIVDDRQRAASEHANAPLLVVKFGNVSPQKAGPEKMRTPRVQSPPHYMGS